MKTLILPFCFLLFAALYFGKVYDDLRSEKTQDSQVSDHPTRAAMEESIEIKFWRYCKESGQPYHASGTPDNRVVYCGTLTPDN